ncbi:MAG: hypothetical protein R3D84_13670 [Paracoccaceae bacterium]
MRKIVMIAAAVAAIFAAPYVAAQDFLPRYSVTGSYTAVLDGSAMRFFVTDDTGENTRGAEAHEILGKVFINIVGRTDDGSGTPAAPVLALQLGPDAPPPTRLSEITLLIDGMILTAMTDIGGSAEATNVVYGAGGQLSFDFTGTLIEVSRADDGALSPVSGGVQRQISGSFAGIVPVQ